MSDVLALLAVRNRRPVIMVQDVKQLCDAWHGHYIEEIKTSELTAAELLYGPRVNRDSAQETWVQGNGARIKVGDMTHTHLVHALALVMRTLRERGGYWALNDRGAMKHYGAQCALREGFVLRDKVRNSAELAYWSSS